MILTVTPWAKALSGVEKLKNGLTMEWSAKRGAEDRPAHTSIKVSGLPADTTLKLHNKKGLEVKFDSTLISGDLVGSTFSLEQSLMFGLLTDTTAEFSLPVFHGMNVELKFSNQGNVSDSEL